jgi:small subunit ribosomal protein S16
MLVIRLTRFGKKKHPFYRIVVADKRAPVQGKYLEKIGHYDPLSEDKARLFINKDLAKKWLKLGAKPSLTVHNLLVEAGILKKKIVTQFKRVAKEKTKEAKRPQQQETNPEQSQTPAETVNNEITPEEKQNQDKPK